MSTRCKKCGKPNQCRHSRHAVASVVKLTFALEDFIAWANIHDDGTGRATTQALNVNRFAKIALDFARAEPTGGD